MTRTHWAGLLMASLLMGCTSSAPQVRSELDLTRQSISVANVSGLSGLTTDGEGHLWTVSERDWTIIEFHEGKVLRTVGLAPLGDDVDIESITWMGDNRFALGTERDQRHAKTNHRGEE